MAGNYEHNFLGLRIGTGMLSLRCRDGVSLVPEVYSTIYKDDVQYFMGPG